MKKLCEDMVMSMYREGRLDREIAEAIGYSRVSVTNWRKSRGLPPNRRRRPEKMLDAYKAAMPLERVQELARAEKDGRLVVLPLEKAKWIGEILAERERQDKKWGYPQKNTYCEWASILSEESGELAQALNELNFGRGSQVQMETEAVQVAAVALSILEQSAVTYEVTVKVATALGRLPREEAEAALKKREAAKEGAALIL